MIRSVPRKSCETYCTPAKLNDGFEGGETVFYREEDDGSFTETIREAPRQTEALFFKHELWHEGLPLTAGRKYVLRSDVFYRFPPVTSV